jgi:alkylation response protein AidB-like acyl-CoA dehydrogenase
MAHDTTQEHPVTAVQPPSLPSPWATPRRVALMEQARAFARDEVLPVANELDPRKGEIPRSLVDALARQGYFGITIDAEHGGMGLGVFEYCLITEELARAWMSVSSIIARAQGMGTQVADVDRSRELLRRSAAGGWIGAVALSEPGAGSDLAGVSTRLREQDGRWVISGEKRWCGNALQADFINVLCRHSDPEPGQSRSSGLVPVLLEKERGSFPRGLTGEPIDKIGYHGFVTWNLHFDDVEVSPSNLLIGSEPDGTGTFQAVQKSLNIARVQTAARAVGLARAAVEDTTAYLQERRQFGHPIADFQYLRFELADMAAAVEQGRAFYRQVAHLLDQGEAAASETAMVKLQTTEMAVAVTNRAMQLHGGNGYTTERQVERYWRDARLTTIFEGTSEIQRRTISDRLLGRGPRP